MGKSINEQPLSHEIIKIEAGALQSLMSELGSDDVTIRTSAIKALNQLTHGDAIPALLRALYDPAPEIRQQAILALEKIGTPEALAALKAWRAEGNEAVL